MTLSRHFLFLALAVAVAPSAARADDPPPTKDQLDAAKKAFAEGRALYDQGKYAEAIVKLEESYKLSHSPLLLYSIGRAYEQLGKQDEALAAYKKFLADAPAAAPQRAEVTAKVEAIEKARQAAKPPEPPPPAKPAFELAHKPVEALPPGKPHDVAATAPDDPNLTVTLFYRGAEDAQFTARPMKRREAELVGRIPGPKVTGKSIQYYIEVRDAAGTVVTRSGRSTSPHLVLIEAGAKPHYYEDLNEPGEIIAPDLPRPTQTDRETDNPLVKREPKPEPKIELVTPEMRARTIKAKWISTGAAGAMFATSAIAFLVAKKQADRLETDSLSCGVPPCREFDATYDQKYESVGEHYNTIHRVTFGLGVAAVGAAGYFWYRDFRQNKRVHEQQRAVAVTPVVGDHAAGAVVGGRF